MDASIDFRNIVPAACLEQNGIAGIAQDRHQWQHILLEQRLATRNLDKGTLKRRYLIDDFSEGLFFAFVECVLRIAIIAAKIAKGQPHKHAWSPHPGALSLNRVINLVDSQLLFRFWHTAGEFNGLICPVVKG